MKTLRECLEFVCWLESRIPVNEWSLEGVRVWPLLRSLLFYQLTLSLRGTDGPPPRSGLSARLGRLLGSMVAPLQDRGRNLPRAAPADVFVLTYAGIRQARIDGLFVDIRTGPLIDALEAQNVRCHVWEYAVPPPYRFPRKNPTHLIQRTFDAAQVANALLGRTMSRVQLPGYGGFCEALASEGAFHPGLLERNLHREFGLILRLKEKFDRAFDLINPAVAFTSNVGRYEFALNLACHARNIPTVELQHGVQGPLHGQYSSWTRVPPEGYELLPFTFWCWDEASASTINAWSDRCAPRHHAVVGGIPWLDYCSTLAPGVPEGDPKRKRGLITLQPPEKIYGDGRLLPRFVLDALSTKHPGWSWWVRPHPASPCDCSPLEEEFRRCGIEAEIEKVRFVPLPALLTQADLHLTHSSSAVLEADRFGLRSIVWSELGASLYAPQIEEGTCRAALDAASLAGEIDRMSGAKERRPEPKNPPYPETLAHFLEMGRMMRAARKT